MKILISSFVISVTLVMHTAPVLAQSASLGGQTPESGSSNTKASPKNRQTRRGETTTTGCLLSQNEKYILVTSKQPSVLQLMPAPILKAHVGQKVKVTGTIEDGPLAPPVATAPPVKSGEPSEISASDYFKVRKLKMISGHCDEKAGKESTWIHILSP
jgi:hypothetical protein